MDKISFDTVETIYKSIFLKIQYSSVDLFLCGGASSVGWQSTRDLLRKRLEHWNMLTIFYPEEMFMELLNRKKYDLFELEEFLAENSDLIIIVCESPGSFTEFGAFVSNEKLREKLVVLVQRKYKNDKSFIMQGPVSFLEKKHKGNVIYYNNKLDEAEEEIRKYLQVHFKFLGGKRITRLGKSYQKNINRISGMYYFIMLLLFFYKEVEVATMPKVIKQLYISEAFDVELFDKLYSSSLKRLHKEGMLIKQGSDGGDQYTLSPKGYSTIKTVLKGIPMYKRDKAINKITLDILFAQYC